MWDLIVAVAVVALAAAWLSRRWWRQASGGVGGGCGCGCQGGDCPGRGPAQTGKIEIEH